MMADKLTRETLAALIEDEQDQRIMVKILAGESLNSNVEAKRGKELADLFVELVKNGAEYQSLELQTSRDAVMYALTMSGFNDKGIISVSPERINENIQALLPIVMGESPESILFHSDANVALLSYLHDKEKFNVAPQVAAALDEYLNQDRAYLLLQRASTGFLDNNLSYLEIKGIEKRFELKLPSLEREYVSPNSALPQSEAPPTDLPTDLPTGTPSLGDELEPQAAKLGDDVMRPDYAEVYAAEENASQKYQLDIDLQTEALMKINAIMESKRSEGWTNRTVVDKLRDTIGDGIGDLVKPGRIVYPSESIFSQSLSTVDAAGRSTNTLATFNTAPFSSFKASVTDPFVGPEVFQIIALKAKASGVKHPFLKSTFKDAKQATEFLKNAADALLAEGYKIEDIRVQKSLQPYFEAYRAEKLEFTITEAPEDLALDPDDPALDMKYADKPAKELAERMARMSPDEILTENLMNINGELQNMQQAMASEENQLKMTDFENAVLIRALSMAPYVKDPNSEIWNAAVRQAGLVPSTRDVVLEVEGYFKSLLNKANPNVQTEQEIGSKEAVKLQEAEAVLKSIYPERADKIAEIVGYAKLANEPTESVDLAASDAPNNIDATNNEPEDFSPEGPPTLDPSDPGFDMDEIERANEQIQQAGGTYAPYDELELGNDTGVSEPIDVGSSTEPSAPEDKVQPAVNGLDELHIPDEIAPLPESSPLKQEKEFKGELGVPESKNDISQKSSSLLNKLDWQGMIGKDLGELTKDEIRQCVDVANDPNKFHELVSYFPDESDGWTSMEIQEVTNKVKTLKIVASPLTMDIDSFGEDEINLLVNMPEDLVPEALLDARNNIISEHQNTSPQNESSPLGENTLTSEVTQQSASDEGVSVESEISTDNELLDAMSNNEISTGNDLLDAMSNNESSDLNVPSHFEEIPLPGEDDIPSELESPDIPEDDGPLQRSPRRR
jgi:hypothetical protein